MATKKTSTATPGKTPPTRRVPVGQADVPEPTPALVQKAQEAAGDSDAEAAARLFVTRETWWRWKRGERDMAKAFFELYLIKTGQLPRK